MKHLYLLILSVFFFTRGYAQAPRNDEYTDATTIQALNNCSDNAAYTTAGAAVTVFSDRTESWNGADGPDVWFKFTALRSDVNINVNAGNVNGAGTLASPLIALYQITPDATNPNRADFDQILGSFIRGTDVSTYYKGGLTPGETYYIRVAGGNTGTFKLCINNYSPPLKAGQDCSSASLLCGKQAFTQTDVTGAGANAREAVGTCLDVNSNGRAIEANTAWYRWEAANSGTLTFTITPTSEADDIDWVLYDMGTSYDCSKINGSTAIR
ncbi:MAG: hypothetical protein INR69_19265, partial [Mucilaginibacter polytrichastri]|nr:hypothetical protein [Mucilaginibacter polytrichastri]